MSSSWGTPYQNIGKNRYRPNSIDVHSTYLLPEILRQSQSQSQDSSNAGVIGGNSVPSASDSANAPQPEWASDDVYMYFDSTHRNFTSNLSIGQLIFDINPINNQQPLDNVVSMRINSFYFPNVTTAVTVPNYFFFGRAYMGVSSSTLPATQSVLSFNGNNYHYELDITNVNTVAVKMEPLDPIFYFQRPIQSLSQITFNFMTPLEFKPIPIPNDTLNIIGIAGTNPAQFQIVGDTTAELGPVGIPTAPGIAVYFAKFVSANNALNIQVTSPTGYFADNIISASTFSVSQLNFTTLAANTTGTCTVAKNRIGIEVRFKSFRQQLTNGLVATNM